MDGPYTNGGLAAAAVDAHLTHGLGAAPAAWLIASEAPLWDRAGLTQAWLARRGTITAQRELTRVTVTRYQFAEGWRDD